MAYVSLGADSFRQDEIREARRRQARIEREAPRVEGDMAALTRLQTRGWGLGADDDLEAIEGHIGAVVDVYKPLEFGSKLYDLINEAREAVRTERSRRNLEHDLAVQRQRDRIRYVHRAAKLVGDAADCLDAADGIEDRRDELCPHAPVGSIDHSGMDDAELGRAIAESDRNAASMESASSDWIRAAELLSMVKDARFRRYAKVAEGIASESDGDAASYRERAQAARAELESRKAVDDMDVDALRARVAELEQIVAASAVETTA